jgi:hypothetical protein
MDALITLMRSTQKKAVLLVHGGFAARAIPYFGCLLFIEIYYLLLKISMVYGTMPAVVSGAVMVVALFAAVLGAGMGRLFPMIILIFLCEIHAVFSLSTIITVIFRDGIEGPVWLSVFRGVLIIPETVVAFGVIIHLNRHD